MAAADSSGARPARKRNRYVWHEYVMYALVTAGLLALGAVSLLFMLIGTLVTAVINPFKSIKHAAGAALVVVAFVLGLFALWYTDETDLGDREVSIRVEADMSFAELTGKLLGEGLIDYPALFKLTARIQGLDRRLWVGRYDFSGGVSPQSILRDLREGNVATFSFTVPEGLRIAQTAGILSAAFEVDSALIVSRCYDTSMALARYGLPDLEGYLYPETYVFPVGAELDEALKKMVVSAKEALEEARQKTNPPDPAHALGDAIILASIIEAEAADGDERRTISSVYHNRLRRGMPLQADPTIRFGLNLYHRRLFYKDLDKDHPYNTYRRTGLTPGPINSPGMAAIEAALNPESTEYLYFVADGTGKHIFSRTVSEHNRAKQATRADRRRGFRRQ